MCARSTIIDALAGLIALALVGGAIEFSGERGGDFDYIGAIGASRSFLWRGNANHVELPSQFDGSASWSRTTRSMHRSGTAFRRIRVALPTFSLTGDATGEADFTSDYKFQVAIEYPFNFTRSGVPVRPNFTFSGATTATYNHLTGPFGYVLSDVFDLGVTVPAGTTFGIWTTIENALGAASPAGTMPQSTAVGSPQAVAENVWEMNEIGTTSLIAINEASTQTAPGQSLLAAPAYVPVIIVEQQQPNATCVAIFGDSIAVAAYEGTGGADGGVGLTGRGSVNGNGGWPARYINDRLGIGYTNFSIGSEQMTFVQGFNATRRRRSLLTLVNPTHVLITLGTNDAAPSTALLNSVVANLATATRAKVLAATLIPATTGAWTLANGSDQTVVAGFGVGSTADIYNSAIRALAPNISNSVDPQLQAALATSGSNSWKWFASGTAIYATSDGIHPTSQGALRISNGLPATSPFN